MTTPISSLAGQARRPRIGVDFHTFDGLYQGSRSHLLGLYRDAVRRAPEYDFVFFCAEPAKLREADPAFAMPNVQCVEMPHGGGLARLGWQLALLQRRHRIDLLHVQYRMPLLPWGACAVTIHDTLFETHPQFFTKEFLRMARFTGRLLGAARGAAADGERVLAARDRAPVRRRSAVRHRHRQRREPGALPSGVGRRRRRRRRPRARARRRAGPSTSSRWAGSSRARTT